MPGFSPLDDLIQEDVSCDDKVLDDDSNHEKKHGSYSDIVVKVRKEKKSLKSLAPSLPLDGLDALA